jgi:hypothetical protein
MRPFRNWGWIHSPFVDLALISFSWLPIYFSWELLNAGRPGTTCDIVSWWECSPAFLVVLAAVLFINNLHRHYTIGLVYGDERVFKSRSKLFVRLPLVLLAVVVPLSLWKIVPSPSAQEILAVAFGLIAALELSWNTFHTVMQKYGFLRIYSAKLGYGDARLDKKLLFAWFAVAITGCVSLHRLKAWLYFGATGFPLVKQAILGAGHIPDVLFAVAGAYALYVTASWVRAEAKSFVPMGTPRVLFAASYVLMALTFGRSVLLGALVFAFSHAVEYGAFVNLYSLRKYRGQQGPPWSMAGVMSRPLLSNFLLAAYVGLIYHFLGFYKTIGLVSAYGITTALLHYVYDGLLWKMSNPEVRSNILALAATPASTHAGKRT